MALFRYATDDDLANLKLAPTQEQTKMFDTLGRNSGSRNSSNSNSGGNLFTKKANSFENAFGTTGAALYETRGDLLGAAIAGLNGSDYQSASSKEQNEKTANLLKNADQGERDILSKYGYNNRDEYYDKLDSLEAAGDTEAYNNLVNTVGAEIRDLYSGVKQKQEQTRDKYDDYVANNYASQKINQDRGKFLGSAINTLSTMSDVMLPGAGVAFNAIQGGVEGIADELEENGLENFDWGRAGQNALIGATTGAVTGALNKGISSKLAQNGGNLFKGGNKLTQAINNAGSNTALGRVGSTLATGVARGAASGAVGGATGAGLSAALNGQDVLGSAIQGAQQGFGQGAMAGGIMAGANMLASKTPGVGTAMQKFNEAGEDWNTRKANGESFGERLANTWDESTTKAIGDKVANSRLGNRIGEDVNAVKQGFQDVGQGLGVLARRGVNAVTGTIDDAYTNVVNKNAVNRLSEALSKATSGGTKGNTKFVRISGDLLDDFNNIRASNGLEPLSSRQVIAYENAINNNLINRVNEGMSPNDVAQMAFNALTSDTSKIVPGYYENQVAVSSPGMINDYDGVVIGRTNDGGTSLKSIEPRTNSQIEMFEQTGQQKIGPKSQLGSSPVEEQLVNNSIVPQNAQNVNTEPFMAYGESDLVTGRTQKQNLISKAGRAMQAAQANATRKETRDIGIGSAGELINKVRQRTGLSDLEKQAAFAKELTGGENSLLDKIQSNAIAATEDGSTRLVNLDSLVPQIDKLINDAPNTLISPSKKEEVRSNILADLRNGSIDAIRKANNFKSAAAQQYLINERTPNDSAKELGKLYTKVGDLVDEASYSQIPQSQVEAMFDIGANEARARAQVAASEGRKEYEVAYNKLADELDASPKTIKAYRGIKKDYVDVSKLNKKTQQGATAWNNNPLTMGTAITAAMATGNPLVAVPAAWAAKTFAPAIGQAAIDTSAKLGGKIADWGDNLSTRRPGDVSSTTNAESTVANSDYNPATQIYNMVGRTEGLNNAEQARTADYLVNAAQEAEIVPSDDAMKNAGSGAIILPNGTASTSVYNALTGGNTNGQMSNSQSPTLSSSSYFPTTGDYWTDIIGNAMSMAMEANDANAFASLYAMYQEQLSNLKKNSSKDGSDLTSWSSSDRSKLLSAQNAMDQIDQLESAYNSATGGNGGNFLQGNLRSLAANISGGNLDASANNYNKLAESVGMGIVKNLINLGVTEADAQRYLEYLPALTDTKEQAAQKLETLRKIYQSQINNLYSAYGV